MRMTLLNNADKDPPIYETFIRGLAADLRAKDEPPVDRKPAELRRTALRGPTVLGMQVYDTHRAVDYLLTRPEVDGDHLGITGASGGGNQTMYAGALDERFQAVVPVCSVGNYQAYLQAACCVCEVLPGALRFTEEGDVLGLVAPRALMVINATKDAFQFSVGEAEKSVARAKEVYKAYGAGEKLAHVPFESPHDYSRAMREAMYGWMTRWLNGDGEHTPILEPPHE